MMKRLVPFLLCLLASFPAGADITHVGTVINDGSSEDVTITKPAGTVQGDVVFACYGNGQEDATSLTLTGGATWTLIDDIPSASFSDNRMAAWYKVAGASEPASYTFDSTGSSSSQTVASISTFRGLDVSGGLDVTYVRANHYVKLGNDTTPAPPTITTNTNGALVVICMHHKSSTATAHVPSSGYDARGDFVQNNENMLVQSRVIATAGAETPGDITLTDDDATTDPSLITVAFMPELAGALKLRRMRDDDQRVRVHD